MLDIFSPLYQYLHTDQRKALLPYAGMSLPLLFPMPCQLHTFTQDFIHSGFPPLPTVSCAWSVIVDKFNTYCSIVATFSLIWQVIWWKQLKGGIHDLAHGFWGFCLSWKGGAAEQASSHHGRQKSRQGVVSALLTFVLFHPAFIHSFPQPMGWSSTQQDGLSPLDNPLWKHRPTQAYPEA